MIVATIVPICSDLDASVSIAALIWSELSRNAIIGSLACEAEPMPSVATSLASAAAVEVCWAFSAVLVTLSTTRSAASRADSTLRTWVSAPWATSDIAIATSVTARLASSVLRATCSDVPRTPLDTSVESVLDGALQLSGLVGKVVRPRALLDRCEIDAHRGERVEVEGLDDGLHVEIEDSKQRPLGAATHDRPDRLVLAQLCTEQVDPLHVAAEVPLHRQVDDVVQPSDAQPLLKEVEPELTRAGGLVEDRHEVVLLRLFEVLAHVLATATVLIGEAAEELGGGGNEN